MIFVRDCFDMFSEKIPVVRPNSKYFWNGSTNIDEPLANEPVNDNPQINTFLKEYNVHWRFHRTLDGGEDFKRAIIMGHPVHTLRE